MGSNIALPALELRPPAPQPDMADQYMRMSSLLGQRQLQQGQIQLQQQQLQANSRKQQEGDVVRQAFVKNNGDIDKTITDASQNSVVSPETLQALQLHSADLKSKRLAASDAALKLRATQVDNLRGVFKPVYDMPADTPPDQLESAYQQQRALAFKDPEAYGIVNPAQVPEQFPGKQMGSALMASMTGESKQLAEEADRREGLLKTAQTGEAAAKGQEATASAQLKQNELSSGLAPGIPLDKMEAADWLRKNPGKSVSDFMRYKSTLVPAFNFNLQNQGATGGPGGQPSAMAQSIATNQMKWGDVVSARTPMAVKQALLAEVKKINPNYNSGDFQVEQAVKTNATSGAVGQQLLAIGTAREHMKTFSQLADALDNNDVQLLNKIGNTLGVQFGSDKTTNFNIAAQAFGGEVGRALDGAGVVASEREQAQKSFNAAMSKGQFKGAVQTVDALLAGKQRAAHTWFDQAAQAKPDFGNTPAGASAQPQANTKASKWGAPIQ